MTVAAKSNTSAAFIRQARRSQAAFRATRLLGEAMDNPAMHAELAAAA